MAGQRHQSAARKELENGQAVFDCPFSSLPSKEIKALSGRQRWFYWFFFFIGFFKTGTAKKFFFFAKLRSGLKGNGKPKGRTRTSPSYRILFWLRFKKLQWQFTCVKPS